VYTIHRPLDLLIAEVQNIATHLSLGLLLGGNDLEVARVERLLLLLRSAGATLLGDFRPTATCRLVLSRRSCVAFVDNALVGELAAAEELFSKVAGVERAGGGMHRFRDELSVGRETEERRDKVFGY
jgi:hypothetical protein